MSDAVPLPPRPSIDYYRKLAKDLQHDCESGTEAAVREWAMRWIETLAQLRKDTIPPGALRREVDRLTRRWNEAWQTSERSAQCLLADAQFFVAREHGFASWPKFAAHVESLQRHDSPVSHFESAAEAIVHGDTARLAKLLEE